MTIQPLQTSALLLTCMYSVTKNYSIFTPPVHTWRTPR